MTASLSIMKLDIHNEMDVVLAHRRAMQFARYSGISLAEQTRFATAVSEICRNVLEHADGGKLHFSISKEPAPGYLEATVQDHGGGISNIDEILSRRPDTHRGRGIGMVYARRLTDHFHVNTSPAGTAVTLRKNIPARSGGPVNKIIIDGWLKHIAQEPALSAYEELKIRNSQLLELTEELRLNSKTVETQMVEIRQLNRQLSDNNHRMKEFTYAISHDLKNPLSTLKLATQQLAHEVTTEDGASYQAVVERSVNRLDKTINSLIEILDIQNQTSQLSRQLEFEKLFAEVRENYSALIHDTGATLHAEFTQAPMISYIEGYLASIFSNLVSNSLKYRHPDIAPVINVSSKPVGDRIELCFRDNGQGMDLSTIGNKLFAPFNRFATGVEGKGIGLYLVKGMVEHNGGSVSVQSEPGKGTIFTFLLAPYV